MKNNFSTSLRGFAAITHGLSALVSGLALLKIFGGVLLIYAAAHISIPIQPVPVTLQTLAVLLLALTYGRWESLASIITYVGAGMMGAPIFAGGKFGAMVLLSPTGGYIIGFVVAVFLVGLIKEKWQCKKFLPLLFASLSGLVAIFTFGMMWLFYLFGFDKAIAVGLVPFILPELVKAFLLAGALFAVGFFKK
ncbi:MAG: biotin transporter BioY [Alphaproteobacteria bacterium]